MKFLCSIFDKFDKGIWSLGVDSVSMREFQEDRASTTAGEVYVNG
jgi:hypothetical protein